MSDIYVVTKNFLKKETVLVLASLLALVTIFIVPPDSRYLGYMDWKVISCLFCLMAVVAGLRKSGLFERMAAALVRLTGSLRSLAFVLVMTTFVISMFITNDVALITFVPFTLMLTRNVCNPIHRIHIIVLQTIAANAGSCLTPVGNPQNLFLFTYYQMEPATFFTITAPIVIVGAILLSLSIFIIPCEPLDRKPVTAAAPFEKHKTILYFFAFFLAVFAVFHLVDYRLATIVIIVLILAVDRSIFRRIDYSLLFTFAAFFIFIGNLQRIEQVRNLLVFVIQKNVLLTAALASQAISNVPSAILLSPFTNNSADLLKGVSIGGMGTIIASLASVISFKFYSHEYPAENSRYLIVFSMWNVLYFAILYAVCIVTG